MREGRVILLPILALLGALGGSGFPDGRLKLATGMARNSKLPEEAKVFVVTSLAMYDGPSLIAKQVKERFGVEITPQAVQDYDPTLGKSPAKKWKDLFDTTRARFLEDTSSIPIANRAVRLHRLNRMAEDLEKQGNRVAAAQLMEQAAKDAGGSYTNRRELTGKGGKPLVPGTPAVWVINGKELPLG